MITAALGIFFIALTLMAIQVRNGRDPALGPGPIPATATQTVKPNGKPATPATPAKVATRTSPVPP